MDQPLVMIVEDDTSLNRIFSIAMKTDFEVESFAAGDAAIARLAQVEPVLVVLDLQLPGASGRDVLATIRADSRLEKTRVILTTADDRQAEVLQRDADMVLLKPVSPGQLRMLALRLCGKPAVE